MKVKMTNLEMEHNIEVLSSLNETGRLGYAVARNLRLLKDNATEYLETKASAIREYGTLDEEKGVIAIDNALLNDMLKDIRFISHEFDAFQVDEETFVNGSMTSQQMELLLWMVHEEV